MFNSVHMVTRVQKTPGSGPVVYSPPVVIPTRYNYLLPNYTPPMTLGGWSSLSSFDKMEVF